MYRLGVFVALVGAQVLVAQGLLDRAEQLYHRTDYRGALGLLLPAQQKDGPSHELIGKCYFMEGEYKRATDAFEKAFAQDPHNSEYAHWLGRTWGRRAETSNWFVAPGNASKARQYFERAVALNPKNGEALNDLFDYYLQAPGFLGGGSQKAVEVARLISELDPAEGHFAQAQLADKRKEYNAAVEQLRRAAELAPRQVGRLLDVAKYLSKLGRVQESEQWFDKAAKLAPNSPKVLFERASTYIRDKRNLDEARELLKQYLKAPLTPDDPPRERAERLLKQAGEV